MPIDLLAQPADLLRALPAVMAGSVREPMPEVIRRLRATGLRLPAGGGAADLLFDAIDTPDSLWDIDPDDAVVNVALVVAGRRFTHRLSAEEIAEGRLRLDPDVPGYAFDHILAGGLTLPEGQAVGLFDGPMGEVGLSLAMPEGTYERLGLAAGDLVVVAFDDGVARLGTAPEVGDPARLAADLAATLSDAGVVEIDQLIDEVLLADAEHFRTALPPISELLAAGGFGRRGDWIASSPEVISAEEVDHDLQRVAREFELEPAEARVVVGALWYARALQETLDGASASGRGIPEPGSDEESIARWEIAQMDELQAAVAGAPVQLLEVRRGLSDPWLAFATADEALSDSESLVDGLELLCTSLLESDSAPPTRAERASLQYLLGRCREQLGEPLAAERHFKASVAAEPEHSYALLGLAGIAADRGQYEAAQGLIDRAGADEHHPLRTAVRIALDAPTAPARLPGRNEPCWCGSGRKFKACHARVSSSPLPARARGLLGRAVAWLALTQPGAIRELMTYAMAVGGTTSLETVGPLVPDLLLFEGGALADYLDRRAELVPADEAMLAQQWLLRPRSLYEVEAVAAGQGLTLRDVMTGDRAQVVERSASTQLRGGELLLARVGHLVDHDEIFGGGAVVSLGEREALIALLGEAPSPLDLVRFVARRFAGPEIQTSGGDPLEFVEGTFTTTAPARLRRALDARLDPAGDGSWTLLEPGTGPTQRVLGSVELAGRTLTASAMSQARYATLLEILDALDVPLVEKSREVQGMDRVRAEISASEPGTGASGMLSPEEVAQSPELLAHLTEYVAQFERSWLDESIPALGGVTPREAADDPTRRGDLVALLDSFPSTGSPTQMDGKRLKVALGLE